MVEIGSNMNRVEPASPYLVVTKTIPTNQAGTEPEIQLLWLFQGYFYNDLCIFLGIY